MIKHIIPYLFNLSKYLFITRSLIVNKLTYFYIKLGRIEKKVVKREVKKEKNQYEKQNLGYKI